MRGLANVGKQATDLRKSVLLQPYSKVILNVDEDIGYEVGNDTGLTLEIDCPWGTQQMAEDILARVRGYQYQPYTATGVIMNPAIEMGDAVQINGVYGGVYQQDAIFGHTFYSDLSAPEDEQLDHEFTYETAVERKIVRQKGWTKTQMTVLEGKITAEVEAREADGREFRGALEVQAEEISARVSKTGGDNSSFGWSLQADEFGLYSGSKKVFSCDSTGVNINGVIRAKSGLIGCNSNYEGGFEITTNAIKNGKNSYNDSANGVFVGTSGIGLGKGAFYVTSAGKLYANNAEIVGKITATSGEFTGKITATSGSFHGNVQCSSITFDNGVTINGANITNGTVSDGKISGVSGSKVGSGIDGGNINGGSVGGSQLAGGSVSTGKIAGGAVTQEKLDQAVRDLLASGEVAKARINTLLTSSATFQLINVTSLNVSNLRVDSGGGYRKAAWRSYKDGDGASHFYLTS